MTTNNQHTPGPWRTATDSFGTFVETTGASIAKIGSPDDEINQANARLIAAAPDLLKELSNLADLLDAYLANGGSIPGLATTNKARAIITKATIPSA